MIYKREEEVIKAPRFLRFIASLFMIFFIGSALGAGYSCPTFKKYTSCVADRALSSTAVGNACNACGSNAHAPNGNTATVCYCNAGHMNGSSVVGSGAAGGAANSSTVAPGVACTAATRTVTYNINGGSGTAPAATTCPNNASCALNNGATTSFYRAGYVLAGWSTSSAATSGSFTITVSANTTVYAVWTACTAGTYKASSAFANASCSACSALTGVSPSGGTYTSVSPFNAATTCRYTAPAKTITGCSAVTSNQVTYTGSAWPASTYSARNISVYLTNSE